MMMCPDLAKYSSIELLLPNRYDFCIILIFESETKFNIEGHRTALLKYDGMYEYFDPYGNDVDVDLMTWMDAKARATLHEGKPYLTYLLKRGENTFIIKLDTRY